MYAFIYFTGELRMNIPKETETFHVYKLPSLKYTQRHMHTHKAKELNRQLITLSTLCTFPHLILSEEGIISPILQTKTKAKVT